MSFIGHSRRFSVPYTCIWERVGPRKCVFISRVSLLSFHNSSGQARCQKEPSLRLGLGTNVLRVGCVCRGGSFRQRRLVIPAHLCL